MSDRDEFGTFAIGFLVGSLTAGVVALLFAPQSGEETRTLIKEKSIELRDTAQHTAEEAVVRAEAIATQARTRAEVLATETRARADEFARQFKLRKEPEVEAVGAGEMPGDKPVV